LVSVLNECLRILIDCKTYYNVLFGSSTRDHHARRRIVLADVQRITLNASCMTISGGRTEQLDIFCRVTGFTSDFLSFINVEIIILVLSRSRSTASSFLNLATGLIIGLQCTQ